MRRAIRCREQMLQSDGPQFDNMYLLADTLVSFGRMQEAADQLNEARRLLTRAIELRRQIEELFPDRSNQSIRLDQMLEVLGTIAYRQGDTEQARADDEEAIQLARAALARAPNDAGRLTSISELFSRVEFTDLRSPAEAVTLAARAVELTDRRDAAALLALGHAHLANNQPTLARDALEQAARLEIPCEKKDLRDELSAALAACGPKKVDAATVDSGKK